MIAIFLPASKVDTNLTFSARLRAKFSRETTQRVDILGCLSLLAASVLLVFALESGGSQYPWNSAPIIATFTLSGLSWILFITWELYLEKTNTAQEPIFPMRLLKDRQLTSMMFNTFFTGFPFVTILFLIPQHAQAVYGVSPVQASLSVLPLLLTSPAATAFSGVLTSTFNIPPAYLIIIGSAIGALAVGLAITIPLTGNSISAKQYGFEAMMGVGFGLSLSTVLTLGQLLVDRRDAGMVLPLFYPLYSAFSLLLLPLNPLTTNSPPPRSPPLRPNPSPHPRRHRRPRNLLRHTAQQPARLAHWCPHPPRVR